MAKLKTEVGAWLESAEEIQSELTSLGVELKLWPVLDSEKLQDVLGQEVMSDEDKNRVLSSLDPYFEQLKNEANYQDRDLISLAPSTPDLDAMLAKFDKCHTHDDDEVRYIIDGEGVFGFVRPDGSQIELLVQAGEYINVPKDTEHWFYLTEKRRIKAVRYFSGKEGWVPKYTDTEKRI